MLVFILVFKVSTEFPGKYVLVGRLIKGEGSSFKSLGVFFLIFLFQGQDSLSTIKWCSFLCFVVSKLWEKGWGTSAILPDWQLWVVSLKMGKESPLPHNSSFLFCTDASCPLTVHKGPAAQSPYSVEHSISQGITGYLKKMKRNIRVNIQDYPK